MSLVVVVQRNGIFASLNQKYHVALIDWWCLHWRKT